MAATKPLGPFKLVTVNTAPERAKLLVGRVIKDLEDRYTIIHTANAENIESVAAVVEEAKPEILLSASMWTAEESQRIQNIAKQIVPQVRTFAIPHGLQVEKGPDAVVEYLKEHLPSILDN